MRKIFIIFLLCALFVSCGTTPQLNSETENSALDDDKNKANDTNIAKETSGQRTDYNALFLKAVRENNAAEVNRCLSNSPGSLNYKDNVGKTGLMYAVESGNRAIVELLLEKGANADIQDSRGFTALIYGVQKNNVTIVDLLLREKYGINVNFQTTGQRNSALHYAVEANNAGIVKLLLEHKLIQTNLADINGETAFMIAVKNNYRPLIRLFGQSNGFDISQRNKDGLPALLFAIEQRVDVSTIQEIIDNCKGAVNSYDTSGKGPFDYLAMSTYSERDKQTLTLIFNRAIERN